MSTETESEVEICREDIPQPGNNLHRSQSWSGANVTEEETEALVTNAGGQSVKSPNSNSSYGAAQIDLQAETEDHMRRRLRFFFMNPIEKWHAKKRFPYKFLIQLIKIFLVTAQLCFFANNRYKHVDYAWDSKVTFSHLFIRGWDAAREVNSYPPAFGPLALYLKEDFFQTVDYAMEGYRNVDQSIGPYSYDTKNNTIGLPLLCFSQYKEGTVFGFNESYIFDSEVVQTCVALNLTASPSPAHFSSKEFLKEKGINVLFSSLIQANLTFSLRTVNFKAASSISPPDCYTFDIDILFDNADQGGQMLLSLDVEPVRVICNGNIKYNMDSSMDSLLENILNCLVIMVCCISLILCSRAIYRAQLLKGETIRFFQDMYGKVLSNEGRWEFLNLWYVMIIVNDVLIITGSAIKDQIDRKLIAGDQWNACSVLLGTGNLFVWFGVLRYLGFFKTYNVVILTVQNAAPKVIRFLLCAILIYAGFTFCGWLVLGPYHIKFRTLSSTAECLFALINGDDMYATFTIMSLKSPMLWWFCRFYLYSFISLYIYVVLSLFISVIMDAYETIKLYYKEGFPKTDVQAFMAACTDEASSGLFRSGSFSSSFPLFDAFERMRSRFRNAFSPSSSERLL